MSREDRKKPCRLWSEVLRRLERLIAERDRLRAERDRLARKLRRLAGRRTKGT